MGKALSCIWCFDTMVTDEINGYYRNSAMETSNVTRKEILAFLSEKKDFLKKEFDVENIILFGSYARDEATPESDIDILIESKKKGFRKMLSIQKILEERFNKKVDVIYIDSVHPFIMRFMKEELIYA